MNDKNKDVRFKQRFNHYLKALDLFQEAVLSNATDRLSQEGLVQRFEYTFELAWKCLQDILVDSGYVQALGPKAVLEQAFQTGLISHGKTWMLMLQDRNSTTHMYDEKVFLKVYHNAVTEFLPLFLELKERLDKLC